MSGDRPRGRCYIWVTWLSKLLAGEDQCWWRAWYKAHYKYEKVPDAPDRAEFFEEWTRKHDQITARRAEELRRAGWVVKVEDETAFKLAGSNADLAGKADIVAMSQDGDSALVVDAKSGKRRTSDHWQVRLYLFALPLAWLRVRVVTGEVEYQDGTSETPALDDGERARIVRALKKVSGPDSPSAVPSRNECRYCDVAACTVRFVEDPAAEGDARGIF